MKKTIIRTLTVIAGLYIVLCGFLFFFQERLIFFPQKLDKDHKFEFAQAFEELFIKTNDGKSINVLLFKSEDPNGLIFYLHGNAGCLKSWGEVAEAYTNLNYDVCIIDYRGYGKSEGYIFSQNQLYEDNQLVYNEMKNRYCENKIIVLGYSIGTGLAAKLASVNNPKLLILQAPYYSLTDVMKHNYPFVPTFLLKYKFATNEYLKNCKLPVVIFHGNQDKVIYYESSLKLKEEFNQNITLITLKGQGHNGMTHNEHYITKLAKLLKQ